MYRCRGVTGVTVDARGVCRRLCLTDWKRRRQLPNTGAGGDNAIAKL
jgi:hypothetical protein